MPSYIRLIAYSVLLLAVNSLYCSSACIDAFNTCNTQVFGDCTVCTVSVYSMVPNATGCMILNQTQVLPQPIQVTQVDLTTPVNLSGFTSSSLSTYSCGAYQLSGQYGSGDYIQKLYSTVAPHYLLKLRFNVAYMGTWGTSDLLLIEVDGVPFSFNYSCADFTSECTPTDCIRIRQANFSHMASTALAKFSSTSAQAKSVASWGISNLMVVLKTCHSQCSSCFGPTINDCYTCSSGFFLLGNACLDKCPLLSIPSMNLCTVSCPNNYFKVQTTMRCEPCAIGCSICSGPLEADCITEEQIGSLWDRKKEFWIFLIVFCSLLVLMALICLILRKRATSKIQALNQPMIKPSQQTEGNIENIPTQLNNNSLVDFTLEDRTKTVRQIESLNDQENSNSSSSDSSGESRKKRKWRGNEHL